MAKNILSDKEVELQQIYLKNNKITVINSGDSTPKPYGGKPIRQAHYRKDKSVVSRLFHSQDTSRRDYGGGSMNSSGQGE